MLKPGLESSVIPPSVSCSHSLSIDIILSIFLSYTLSLTLLLYLSISLSLFFSIYLSLSLSPSSFYLSFSFPHISYSLTLLLTLSFSLLSDQSKRKSFIPKFWQYTYFPNSKNHFDQIFRFDISNLLTISGRHVAKRSGSTEKRWRIPITAFKSLPKCS